MKLYPDSRTKANSLAGWSGKHPWKEHDWKISDKKVWGRGISVYLPVQVKNVKIFRFQVSATQRVTLAVEDFNNQVDRMGYSLGISPAFSPATPVITRRVHKHSGHNVRGGGLHRLSNMNFHSPRLTDYC